MQRFINYILSALLAQNYTIPSEGKVRLDHSWLERLDHVVYLCVVEPQR